MANNRNKKDQGGGNPGNLTGEGSGQQTSGNRGQKLIKHKKSPYHRSTTEKGQQGRHGGTR